MGTLKKVSTFGFKEVETYVDYGNINYYWKGETNVLKEILDDADLRTYSSHYPLNNFKLPGKSDDDLKRYVAHCIQGAFLLKQEYIIWPLLNPELRTIEKFKLLAERLNTSGGQIKNANLQLAYHNQGVEFDEQHGQTGFDIILNETDQDLVKMELDTYWFSYSSKFQHIIILKNIPVDSLCCILKTWIKRIGNYTLFWVSEV